MDLFTIQRFFENNLNVSETSQQMVVNTQSVANMSPDEMKLMSALSNKSLDSAKVFIAMIPMLLIYPFIQKYFVSGMMIGAVKG